jgi:hypothetical protein
MDDLFKDYGRTRLVDDKLEMVTRIALRRVLKHHGILDNVIEGDLLALVKTGILNTRKQVAHELRMSAFLHCDVNKEHVLLAIEHGADWKQHADVTLSSQCR